MSLILQLQNTLNKLRRLKWKAEKGRWRKRGDDVVFILVGNKRIKEYLYNQ